MAIYHYLDTRRKWNKLTIDESANAPGGLMGKVYPVSDQAVAKIYLERTLSDATARDMLLGKVTIMAFNYQDMGNLSDSPMGWPLGPLFKKAPASLTSMQLDRTAFCGYLMPRVASPSKLWKVFTETKIGTQNLSGAKLLTIASRIAEIVAICHKAGFIIGDVNPNNFLISGTSLAPALIDCDSFQFKHKFKSGEEQTYTTNAGTLDYCAPALLARVDQNKGSFTNVRRTQEDDEFAIAVLIFQILMSGVHPFDTLTGPIGDTKIPNNIRNRAYPYSDGARIKPPKFADEPRFRKFSPQIRGLFERVFARSDSVAAKDWAQALKIEARKNSGVQIAPLPTAHANMTPKAPSFWQRVKKLFGRKIG